MSKIQLLTTPAKIKALKPCKARWAVYRDAHPGPMDKPYPFLDIIDSNGVDDARWVLNRLELGWGSISDESARIASTLNSDLYRQLRRTSFAVVEPIEKYDARCARCLRKVVGDAERAEARRRRDSAR